MVIRISLNVSIRCVRVDNYKHNLFLSRQRPGSYVAVKILFGENLLIQNSLLNLTSDRLKHLGLLLDVRSAKCETF